MNKSKVFILFRKGQVHLKNDDELTSFNISSGQFSRRSEMDSNEFTLLS